MIIEEGTMWPSAKSNVRVKVVEASKHENKTLSPKASNHVMNVRGFYSCLDGVTQVSEMTSCGFTSWSGFDWDHAEPQTSSSSSLATTIARRLLSGRGATICPKGCVEVGGASGASSAPVTSSGRGGRQRDSNTCAAGFFAAMKVKGEKEGWMVSSRRGDPSAWGCCQGSILATQILACHRLSPATCALSGTCQLHGDECDITPEALSKVAFASEAEEGMGREEAPSADLARQLLSLPSRCARLGVEECNQATVDVDPRRVSEYISLPFLSDDVEPAAGAQGGVLHDNHPIDNPDVCVRASERAAKELESFLADDGDIVIDLPAEDGPHEDEDVVF